jgi:hypothetical protein
MPYSKSYSANRNVGVSHCGHPGIGSGTCHEFYTACHGEACSNNRLWGIWPHYNKCSTYASPCNRNTAQPKATGTHGGCGQIFLVGPCSSAKSANQSGSIISCGPNASVVSGPTYTDSGRQFQPCSKANIHRVCSINLPWFDAIYGSYDLGYPHFQGRVYVSKNL